MLAINFQTLACSKQMGFVNLTCCDATQLHASSLSQ